MMYVIAIMTIIEGCDPNLLYDGKALSIPSEALCDPPLKSVGVQEGFACYIGTFVGATATHHCHDCGYRSVRMCMEDGSWNGTSLQCNCKFVVIMQRM